MKESHKNIAIAGLTPSDRSEEILISIIDLLQKEEKNIFVHEDLVKKGKSLEQYSSSNKRILESSDLLISIGGDGTMLSNAKLFGIKGIPILGLNLGSLGFLTDIAPEDIDKILLSVLKGEFEEDKRFFLKSVIGSTTLKQRALNEIVLHSGSVAKMIEFDVFVDNYLVYKQRADGLIIFTSTGSTAYSLSGGGPLIHPDLDIIGIMPMFPHSLNTTPIILDQSKKIKVNLTKINSNQDPELSFDGQDNITIKEGSEIHITKSKDQLTLIHPLENDYFFGCREKLGWGKSIVE